MCDDVKCEEGRLCKVREGKVICECPDEFTGDDCLTRKYRYYVILQNIYR